MQVATWGAKATGVWMGAAEVGMKGAELGVKLGAVGLIPLLDSIGGGTIKSELIEAGFHIYLRHWLLAPAMA